MKTNNRTTTVNNNNNDSLTTEIQNRVQSLVERRGEWEGSVSELDQALRTVSRRNLPENWPGSPSVMRRALNRTLYQLRRSGISVRFSRDTSHDRKRIVSFEVRE